MKKHEEKFEFLWEKIVKDTNDFIETNPKITMYNMKLYGSNSISKFTDDLCLSGAWITDRINGKTGSPSGNNYKGSLTKKIRKALGYNI